VFIAYFGAAKFFSSPESKFLSGAIGGAILITFGLVNIFQKHKTPRPREIEMNTVNVPVTILKGFLLNIFNPFVLLFWIGAMGVVSSKADFSLGDVMVFFSATLTIVFSLDILKSYVANKIKMIIKPQLLIHLHRFSGIVLVVFGLSLVYRVVF